MRTLSIFAAILVAAAGMARAQVQEKKLIDRLLEPDMSLQNNAQNKRFTPVANSTSTKVARTKNFYVKERPLEKRWTGGRSFLTKIFGTRRARDGEMRANVKPRNQVTTTQIKATPSAYAAARPARGADQTYAVSEFPGTRPFLGRGKSQKALSQQDRPLTIDEVRELLNKNK